MLFHEATRAVIGWEPIKPKTYICWVSRERLQHFRSTNTYAPTNEADSKPERSYVISFKESKTNYEIETSSSSLEIFRPKLPDNFGKEEIMGSSRVASCSKNENGKLFRDICAFNSSEEIFSLSSAETKQLTYLLTMFLKTKLTTRV